MNNRMPIQIAMGTQIEMRERLRGSKEAVTYDEGKTILVSPAMYDLLVSSEGDALTLLLENIQVRRMDLIP